MATNDDSTRRQDERHEQKSLKGHKESERIEAHKEAARLEAHTPADDEVVPAVTADVDETPRYVRYGAAILLGLVFGVGCYVWMNGGVPSAPQKSAQFADAPRGYLAYGGTAEGYIPDPFVSAFEPTLEPAGGAPAQLAEVTVSGKPVTDVRAEARSDYATAQTAAAPVAVTTVVYLFETDESAVPETSELTAIANAARKQGLSLDVKAYTDEHGRVAYNQKLSERRARAIGDYLVAHGVPASKVKVCGMGPTHAYANDAQDRRAEVAVVK